MQSLFGLSLTTSNLETKLTLTVGLLDAGYMPADLKPCARLLHSLFLMAPMSHWPAVREKYAQQSLLGVSTIPAPHILPDTVFYCL